MTRKRDRKGQILRAAVAAMTVVLPISGYAAEAGDQRLGRSFAIANCAECHAIRPCQNTSPNADAPSFTSVANSPGMTGRALAVWLETSHPSMPNFIVPREDRDNVIAYIMSLQTSARQ
jgi:mono/diheme cytochrome c family protein